VVTLGLYGLLAVGLIGGIFLLAVRLLPAGEQIAPPVRDEPIWTLPEDRPITASDVAEVRLPVALRGYRFAEADQLLDRIVDELRRRDEELARLRHRGGPIDAPVDTPAPPAAPSPPVDSSPPAADPDGYVPGARSRRERRGLPPTSQPIDVTGTDRPTGEHDG
jgi:DivIVA domain-containing protein